MAPLTGKELKEQKKKEKAAKRAAAKATDATVVPSANTNGQKEQTHQVKTASHIKKQLNNAKIPVSNVKIPPMFSHLETREQRSSASPVLATIVHPSILSLSLKMSTYKVVGSNARAVAMMEAFKDVISSYITPEGTSLQRNLTSHLSHQIEYLKTGRPLSVSMGNAIRWLKQRISVIPITTDDATAKQLLVEQINDFIIEKIIAADDVIINYAAPHITNNSRILTFGHSKVLKKLFQYCALKEDKTFDIYIIDSKPLFEGKRLAKDLAQYPENIKCHYNTLGSLSSLLATTNIDYCFLGAHSMLSNGRLYSRVGTALVAMAAKRKNIPVLVCCESLKFSDKVQLDSVTQNELGDPDDLIATNATNKKGFYLEQYLDKVSQQQEKDNKQQQQQQQQQQKGKKNQESPATKESDLSNWKQIPNLNVLNILYDLTPPEYIQKIITEFGALPPSSVPVVLREYKSTN
ncbi:translation initiation factor eIF2B subunit delta [Martiniozyma asiatica (nom. inval.)]|nr:translation initiation factor eIF2B subunit delta [Martiniozyma asiatica]